MEGVKDADLLNLPDGTPAPLYRPGDLVSKDYLAYFCDDDPDSEEEVQVSARGVVLETRWEVDHWRVIVAYKHVEHDGVPVQGDWAVWNEWEESLDPGWSF